MSQELGTPETHIIRLRMLITKQKASYVTQESFKELSERMRHSFYTLTPQLKDSGLLPFRSDTYV